MIIKADVVSQGKKEGTMSHESYSAKFHYKGEVAKRYLERRTRSVKWQREQQVIERLVENLPRGSSILDVPLGTGRFLQYYAKGNHTVYGLDISSDMLSQAREMQRAVNNVKGVIHGDAESIPLRDRAVDYVICMRLLNWLPVPVLNDIISEFKRIARQGIIVEVRVAESIGLLRMIRKIAADPWTTLHRFIHPLLRAFSTNASMLNLSKNSEGDDAAGYVLHNAGDVVRIFEAQGLVVHDVIELDKGIDFRQRTFQPLLVMCCGKGPR